jgi:hypothetical protein
MLKLALFAGMILLLYNQLLSGAEKLSDVETFTFPPEGLSLGQVLLISLCIGFVPLNWAPGEHNGELVNIKMVLPIKFGTEAYKKSFKKKKN